MSTRVVDRVDDWDSQPFSGGYRRLHEIADEEFSGVIRAGGAELYMINGTVVGIQRGSIEDFESASGTCYEAPSPALPLLAIMQERSDEVRDKFYTEKTSISEVDRTLADGGFTGYIELSENVLSGDYYQVYHAGRSMSVAYVGESKRLLDGDEAFETADDEVGIYEVRPVDIDPIEIPEPAEPVEESAETQSEEPATGGADASEPEPAPQDQASVESDERTDPTAQSTQGQQEATDQADPTTQSTQDQQEATDRGGTDSTATQQSDAGTAQGTDSTAAQAGQEPTRQSQQREQAGTGQQKPRDGPAGQGEPTTQPAGQQESPAETERPSPRESDQARTDAGGAGTTDEYGEGGRSQAEETRSQTGTQRADHAKRRTGDEPGFQPGRGQSSTRPQSGTARSGPSSVDESSLDLETRAIPSLDPERTTQPEQPGQGGSEQAVDGTRSTVQGNSTPRRGGTAQQGTESSAQRSEPVEDTTQAEEPASSSGSQAAAEPERIEELEGEIEQRDEEIDRLETELEQETAERADIEDELETVRTERDELETEVEELRDELERLETELGAATDAERRMTGAEALSGTDIFVRYHSKGDATLEKAHDGSHRKDDVNGNLRLEKHTQFDSASVAVGGRNYEEFLESTLEYQFVEWVVCDLLFEIRDTGHTKALKDLYDVLPAIDRAELSGVVDVVYAEDGQETRSQESFDVVLRNRMGNPLLVANLNDSREAATESMMENLITAAERVGQSTDEFSGAFFVTESFFEPGALETASDATKGGLLSRDKRKSFVNLSRKRGYHLCLVEARNENFHLAVPEL